MVMRNVLNTQGLIIKQKCFELATKTVNGQRWITQTVREMTDEMIEKLQRRFTIMILAIQKLPCEVCLHVQSVTRDLLPLTLTLLDLSTMSSPANQADLASNTVIGAEMATSPVIGGDMTCGSSPIGGATPSSCSVSSTSKPSKNIDLLNNSGMGDLKVTKPYKREPLHRFANFVAEPIDKMH